MLTKVKKYRLEYIYTNPSLSVVSKNPAEKEDQTKVNSNRANIGIHDIHGILRVAV